MSETAVNSQFARTLNNLGGEIGGWGPRVEQLKTEITGDNPNTTDVLLAGFAECRLALGSDYPVYLSAATEYAQSPGNYDFDPNKLVASVGAPMNHERTGGHISREKFGILYLLFALVLLMVILSGYAPSPVEANGQTDTPDTTKPTLKATEIAATPTAEAIVASPTATQMEPTIAPTDTPAPTATLEPTNTPEPTIFAPTQNPDAIFNMPTAYKQFEAQWPLVDIQETDGHILRCAVDTANLQYGEVSLPGGLIMKSWAKCYFTTSVGTTDYVNVPIYVEDPQNNKKFMTFAVEPSDLPEGAGYLIPALKKALESSYLPAVLGTPQLGVKVVGASFDPDPSQQITQGQKFFTRVSQGLDTSGFDDFAKNGDTSKLPTVGSVDHLLIIDALNFDIK